MSAFKAVGLCRQWASFGSQRNWLNGRRINPRAKRPISPRKLEPHEVIAKLKARSSENGKPA